MILLAVLLFILVSSLAASAVVQAQSTQAQREKEEQLLFVGAQIRGAILSYYNSIPAGGARSLPRTLDELVTDNRFPLPRHHLRRVYLDPITGDREWRLILVGDRVIGVSSRSQATPIKRAGFASAYSSFANADHYSDWIFRIQ